jgi:opacity protein-like surface antigen
MAGMTSRPHIVRAALAAGLALAALPAAASADSIVFVRDNNVWLSNPDGSGQYQVTTDGTAENPYTSPSQADDGTIVAARKAPNGGPLYRLRQNGDLINTIPLRSMLAGPFRPHVSPDGQLVAYEHVFSKNVNGYIETSSDVRFTRADGSTPDGIGPETGRGAGSPSWIDSNRAFVGINAIATTQVVGQEAVEWWNDYDHQPTWFNFGEDVEDGEVAPNGNVVVVRGDHTDNTIQLYRSNGGFTSPPTPTCTLGQPSPGPGGQQFADPTFSPSGDALAWQEGNGVWSESLPAEDCSAGEPRLLIPGASEPDWGPAPVNPGPRTQPAPAPGPGPAPGLQPGPKHALAASAARTTLSRALAKGLKVRLTVPAGGRVSATATAKGKTVAKGSRKVTKAGSTTVALRFSKQARRKLRRARSAKLAVAIRFTPKGGAAVSERLAITLAR